ncbi:MAG TPA: NUDIX hydrolase [Thermoanaerobaculia bacterium]|nr:NUDIX hydrolase [Thermoanaerobaculia bacterium]
MIRLVTFAALLLVPSSAALAADPPTPPWPAARRQAVLEKTLELRLAPDLSHLTPGERRAVDELLAVGAIMQRLYEESRHHQAAEARERLAALPAGDEAEELSTLYRLFQGPIATTLDNRREPFLAVDPEVPGKNVYPWGIGREEVEAFLAAHPERRDEVLGERTVVRRATAESVARDRAALERHPALAVLHPGLAGRLAALARRPDPAALYAVPYAVAYADELGEAQRRLFAAADAVEGDDAELARYLRNRGRDLLSNDYESGDASWVTGRFRNLNAQIGAYETYDDALFGVKAFHSLSLLVADRAASEELARALADLQAIEDLLPYASEKRVRSDVPVGVYRVVADFGQARGTNTATILPNDPLFSRRYGRTILLRENVMTHPELFALTDRVWRAAVAPELADWLAPEGGFHRTLWHEIGHYLGPDRTRAGAPLDQALERWADALEEMKADLVSLVALHHLHGEGAVSAERLRAVQASGILRTLQTTRPRPDQPYQTMQLAQLNFFLDRGLLTVGEDGRLALRAERYPAVVRELLGAVMEVQLAGDPAAAEAFFARWTAWEDDLHEPLAARLRAAEGPRFRLVRYGALGE